MVIDGQTFAWLEPNDFLKKIDQLKAMLAKLSNSTIIIEPEQVPVEEKEIEFIDDSPKKVDKTKFE